MRSTCTFSVTDFTPVEWSPEVTTGLATGHAHLVKAYDGAISGRSVTQFSYAFDGETNIGTYVAMESFAGSVDGRDGTFNFAHSATTLGGPERLHELFVIVPGSGTGELVGITGSGALVIDEDGTHRIDLDYDLGD
jgi:Protein of unknown function (DUF3224)